MFLMNNSKNFKSLDFLNYIFRQICRSQGQSRRIQGSYTEKKTYLSQVNCVFLSQDENLFESNKNLFGSSIFVFLSQKDFLFESKKKYAWLIFIQIKRKIYLTEEDEYILDITWRFPNNYDPFPGQRNLLKPIENSIGFNRLFVQDLIGLNRN